MLESIILKLIQCDKELEQNSHIVLLAVFLISYIIFNFLFKVSKENQDVIRHKQEVAEKYLKQHDKEDREFFCGEEEEVY